MKSNEKSTFDEFIKDSEQKKLFDEEYCKILLSEFLLEAMEEIFSEIDKKK